MLVPLSAPWNFYDLRTHLISLCSPFRRSTSAKAQEAVDVQLGGRWRWRGRGRREGGGRRWGRGARGQKAPNGLQRYAAGQTEGKAISVYTHLFFT